jgi:hypothetical protein
VHSSGLKTINVIHCIAYIIFSLIEISFVKLYSAIIIVCVRWLAVIVSREKLVVELGRSLRREFV